MAKREQDAVESAAGTEGGRVVTPPPLPRWGRALLVAIFLGYLLFATAYSFATRLKWGPDEPAHFVYVKSLALDFHMPSIQGDAAEYRPGASLSHQRQHPPTYYALAALAYRLVSWLPEDRAWRALRFFSILIGLAALAMQWKLARLLFSDNPKLCLASLALLAFLPMFCYITSVVNNDGLAVVLFTAAVYQWARLLKGADNLKNVVVAGALVGAAILVKESALALVPGLLILTLATRPPGDKAGLPARLGRAGLALGAAALVCGGWFAYNLATAGTPTVYAYVRPLYASVGEAFREPYGPTGYLFAISTTLHRTLLTTLVPWWAMREQTQGLELPLKALVGVLAAVGSVGVLFGLLDSWRRNIGWSRPQANSLALMFLSAAMLAAGIVRYIFFVDFTALQAGRYLIVAWPLLALLGVAGLATLLKRPRLQAAGLLVLVAGWLALNIATLWWVYVTYRA